MRNGKSRSSLITSAGLWSKNRGFRTMVAIAQRECYWCLFGWCKTREEINGAKLDRGDEFCYNTSMTAAEQKEQRKRLLKAKIAVAIQDETGQVPTKEKIEEVFFLARVMYKAVSAHTTRERNRRSKDSWQSSERTDGNAYRLCPRLNH